MKNKIIFSDTKPLSYEARSLISEKFDLTEINPDSEKFFELAKKANYLWVRLGHYLDAGTLKKLKNLKAIATNTTGITHIDIASAKKNNIDIIKLDSYSPEMKLVTSAAEHAVALMFSIVKKIVTSNASVHDGTWDRNNFQTNETSELIAGVVGYGRIGKQISNMLSVICKETYVSDLKPVDIKSKNVFEKEISEIFKTCDIIFLCISESKENYHFFDSSTLDAFSQKPFIINISRGSVIDTKVFFHALKKGTIRGLAFDVIEGEEVGDFSILREITSESGSLNIAVTPHIGGNTKEAWIKTELIIAKRIIEHANG